MSVSGTINTNLIFYFSFFFKSASFKQNIVTTRAMAWAEILQKVFASMQRDQNSMFQSVRFNSKGAWNFNGNLVEAQDSKC